MTRDGRGTDGRAMVSARDAGVASAMRDERRSRRGEGFGSRGTRAGTPGRDPTRGADDEHAESSEFGEILLLVRERGVALGGDAVSRGGIGAEFDEVVASGRFRGTRHRVHRQGGAQGAGLLSS